MVALPGCKLTLSTYAVHKTIRLVFTSSHELSKDRPRGDQHNEPFHEHAIIYKSLA